MRHISRETGKDFRTVKKALDGVEPQYHLTKTKPKPQMDLYLELVKSWLIEDQKVHKKQRHTAKRIFQRLKEEHQFSGSYSTVRRTVRQLKDELQLDLKEAFIPSEPSKRQGSEVDWGEAYIDLNQDRIKIYMFCMRSKFSGKIFVKLYPTMLQECFFNGHIEAFSYFGGIFEEIVYDNLKSAVKKVLTGANRLEQTSFVAFRSYYCYTSLFCNIKKGSEKGGVEGCVGYARRNFLTPIPSCNSLEQINASLLEKCFSRDLEQTKGQTSSIGELFAQEKKQLLSLPSKPYNNYKLIETKVDNFLTVAVNTNRYSVPESYVEKKVSIELGLYDLRITHNNRLIAEHVREFERNKWILDPWHYMALLHKKSRAFKGSRILTEIEKNWSPVVKKLWEFQIDEFGESKGTKEFLGSLLFFQDKPYSEMEVVLELAIENKVFTKESIFIIYETLMEKLEKVEDAEIEHLPKISNFQIPEPDVKKFERLLEARNGA